MRAHVFYRSPKYEYLSICSTQEPTIAQAPSQQCVTISHIWGVKWLQCQTPIYCWGPYSPVQICLDLVVCVCVGGGHACVFACLLVCLFLSLWNGTWREDNSAVEDSSILGCEVCLLGQFPNLAFSRRRNKRRGNVVYHTQNGVGWGAFRCFLAKVKHEFWVQ